MRCGNTLYIIISNALKLLLFENYLNRAPPSTTRPTTTRPPTTTQPTTTQESIITTPETTCTDGEYYSDPASCSNYYRCVRGELKREQCAPGLHWDAKRHLCDWPSAAKCQTKTGYYGYYLLKLFTEFPLAGIFVPLFLSFYIFNFFSFYLFLSL